MLTKPLSLYGVLSQAIDAARGSGAAAESAFAAFWHRFGIGTSRLVQPGLKLEEKNFPSLLDYADALVQHLRPLATMVSAPAEDLDSTTVAVLERNPPAPPSAVRSSGRRRTFLRLDDDDDDEDEDEDGQVPDCKLVLPEVPPTSEEEEERKVVDENQDGAAMQTPLSAIDAAESPMIVDAGPSDVGTKLPSPSSDTPSELPPEAAAKLAAEGAASAGGSPGRKRHRQDADPSAEEKQEEPEAPAAAAPVEMHSMPDSAPVEAPTSSTAAAGPSEEPPQDQDESQSPKRQKVTPAGELEPVAAASPSSPTPSPVSPLAATSSEPDSTPSRKRGRESPANSVESPDLVFTMEASPEASDPLDAGVAGPVVAAAAAVDPAAAEGGGGEESESAPKKAKLAHEESESAVRPLAAAQADAASALTHSSASAPSAEAAVPSAEATIVESKEDVEMAAALDPSSEATEATAATEATTANGAAPEETSEELPLSELSTAMLNLPAVDLATAAATKPRTRPVLHLVNLLKVDAKIMVRDWAATAESQHMRDVLEKFNIDYIVHHPNVDGKFVLVGNEYPLPSVTPDGTVKAWVKCAGNPLPKEEVLPKASVLSLVFANLNMSGKVTVGKAGESRQVPVAELPAVVTNPTLLLTGSGKPLGKYGVAPSAAFPCVLASMKTVPTEGIIRTLEDHNVVHYPEVLHKLWDRVLDLIAAAATESDFQQSATLLNQYASPDSDLHQRAAGHFSLACTPAAPSSASQ
jgi:hypothetical protein